LLLLLDQARKSSLATQAEGGLRAPDAHRRFRKVRLAANAVLTPSKGRGMGKGVASME